MYKDLVIGGGGCEQPLDVGTGRLKGGWTGIVGALSTVLWLGAGCDVEWGTPDCDHDGDGYCAEAVGGMPGGDCCDQPEDVGCGDATQPELIFTGASETCADVGVDNDCDGDAEEVDGLGEPCETEICGNLTCPCRSGLLECVGGEPFCNPPIGPATETCDGLDEDCDGIEDSADLDAHVACGAGSYCVAGSCLDACTIDDECVQSGRGNRCQVDLGQTVGMCMCGDGPTDYACPEHFVCDLHVLACRCGASNKVCGPNEGCSAAGDCTCGSSGSGTIESDEACAGSNAPDCNLAASPEPRCDCSGVLCDPAEACCEGQCTDTNSNTAHCGECSHPCHADQLCCSGICISGSSCPTD